MRAVCGSIVWQYVALWCNVLQRGAVCCTMCQNKCKGAMRRQALLKVQKTKRERGQKETDKRGGKVQHARICARGWARESKITWHHTLHHTATRCNTLQHTATHCNTLQHAATHCNTLQHAATRCNALQHTTRWHQRRHQCLRCLLECV